MGCFYVLCGIFDANFEQSTRDVVSTKAGDGCLDLRNAFNPARSIPVLLLSIDIPNLIDMDLAITELKFVMVLYKI